MTEGEQINQALKIIWPKQVDIVGSSITKNISNNAAAIEPVKDPILKAKGGANFDPHSAAQLLIDAAVFVKISIEIYKLLKDKNKTKPELTEFKNKVNSDARSLKIPENIKQKIPEILEYIKGIL